jgi:hypothetical protein
MLCNPSAQRRYRFRGAISAEILPDMEMRQGFWIGKAKRASLARRQKTGPVTLSQAQNLPESGWGMPLLLLLQPARGSESVERAP